MEEDKTKQKHKIKRNEERIKNGKEHIEEVRRRMKEQFGSGVMGGKAYQMKDVLTEKGIADCKAKQPRFGHRLIPYELLVGSMIPNGIMRYRGFKNESCKLLWGRLAQYAGKDGVVDPGMRTLAKEIGVSIGTIKKCLTELEDKGFIVKLGPQGEELLKHTTTSYIFLWHPVLFAPARSKHPATNTRVEAMKKGREKKRTARATQEDQKRQLRDTIA